MAVVEAVLEAAEDLIPPNTKHGALFHTILGWKRSQNYVINLGVLERKYDFIEEE